MLIFFFIITFLLLNYNIMASNYPTKDFCFFSLTNIILIFACFLFYYYFQDLMFTVFFGFLSLFNIILLIKENSFKKSLLCFPYLVYNLVIVFLILF